MIVDGEAASQPFGQRCFDYEMGLKGALATDQDEPPFAFNFKGSQSGSVDCDDGYPNWKTEVINNCRPFYAGQRLLPDAYDISGRTLPVARRYSR